MSLVATGNTAAAKTWPQKPGLHIAGGGTWTSYTYDPVRDLLYVPAGNPGPDFNGAIRAYRQLVPHDVHDWDVSTPPALITTRAGTAVVG